MHPTAVLAESSTKAVTESKSQKVEVKKVEVSTNSEFVPYCGCTEVITGIVGSAR